MSSLPVCATSLVGRARERGQLGRLVAADRLVTVVGPGGVGKTRLVAEAAQAWTRRFPDGVWWLDLATVREPEMVERLLADEIGLRLADGVGLVHGIAGVLSGRRTLVVLDNCEHLVAACAGLARRLLDECPSARIVATSREPLGIEGEVTYPLPPLQPEEACRLFVERAQARRPDFEATGRTRADVAMLCQRLDHLPFAVELAAARVALMSPSEMLGLLDRRFELLTNSARDIPERHRTLLAAIQWSYRLLEPVDQALLNRLAVFAASFDLATAEAFVGAAALEGIGRLIDKSLVTAAPTPRGTRYRLLESVRAYGLERLTVEGRLVEARDRYLDHFVAAVEGGYEERMSTGSDRLLLTLAENAANLREALEHAHASRPAAGLRLAGAMREEWVRRNPSEGRLWLQRLIPSYPHRDRHLGRALLAAGHIAMVQRAYDEALCALEQSREVCTRAGDTSGEAWATFYLGLTETLANDGVAAQRHLEQALDLQQRIPGSYGVLQARATMGQLLAIQGERLDEGRRLLEDALATARKLGNRWSTGHANAFLGLVELRLHDWPRAEGRFREAARAFSGVNDQVMFAAALCGLARVCVRREPRRGAILAAAANEIHARLASRLAPVWTALQEETRAEAAAAMGRPAADTAWERGRRLTIDEATEAAGGTEPVRRRPGGLSQREAEVAQLVAEGLSNRAIAERLHLSERTAEGHVLHVLNKLGLSNRTQVAGWLHGDPRTD